MDSSTMRFGSKYSGRRRGSVLMYVELDAYRDLGIRQRSCFRGCDTSAYGDIVGEEFLWNREHQPSLLILLAFGHPQIG